MRNPIRPVGDSEALYRQNVERRLRALETRAPGGISGDGVNSYLQSGDLILSDDGAFQVQLANGTTLMVLDDGRLRFNRSDGTRQLEITPGGGLRLYAANGTTLRTTLDGDGVRVGSNVELDATGLHVIGGLVTPVWPFSESASTSNVSLTTTPTDILTRTINPPSWVERLTLISIARLQISNTSGGGQNLQCGITNDDGGPSEQRVSGSAGTHQTNSPATNATTVSNREDITLSPAGRSVDVVMDASVSSGANSSNFLSMSIIGFGTRN